MRKYIRAATALVTIALTVLAVITPAAAVTNPQSGTLGMEATVPGNAPTQAATIAVPSSGQTFTAIPIAVSGLCKSGLLVKIFANNIFVGSATCVSGSYSLRVDLFNGRNDLVARVYDALDQAGPDSNVVSVTFDDTQFLKFGTHVNVTSSYARRGANPGSVLSWPITISGGQAPYAISVDWGDGNGSDLKTAAFAGAVTLEHTYTQAGVYIIVVKVTDSNNTAAYLQLVGVGNGVISGGLGTNNQATTITNNVVLWQPLLIIIPMLLFTFWLGQRYELYAIRRSIEASRQ